jgi:hypothetical protein
MAALLVTLAIIAFMIWVVLFAIHLAFHWIPLGFFVLFVILWLIFKTPKTTNRTT